MEYIYKKMTCIFLQSVSFDFYNCFSVACHWRFKFSYELLYFWNRFFHFIVPFASYIALLSTIVCCLTKSVETETFRMKTYTYLLKEANLLIFLVFHHFSFFFRVSSYVFCSSNKRIYENSPLKVALHFVHIPSY